MLGSILAEAGIVSAPKGLSTLPTVTPNLFQDLKMHQYQFIRMLSDPELELLFQN